MVAKNTGVAIAIILGFAINTRAEDTKTFQTLVVSCNPFSNINNQCKSDSAIKSQSNTIVQNRSRRRGRDRDRNRKIDSFYTGFSLGLGFPDGGVSTSTEEIPEAEYNNTFIGSLFGGIRLNKNISADAEFLLGLGGINTDDRDEFINEPGRFDIDGTFETEADYSAFAFYLNPRFELPLSKSFNLYLSPGVGVSQTIVTVSSSDEATEFASDLDTSNTGFTYQIKGGAAYTISDNIGVFGQLRYVSLPTDETEVVFPDDINFFSTEVGMRFNLF